MQVEAEILKQRKLTAITTVSFLIILKSVLYCAAYT